MQMEPMPLELISLSINAARLCVSAYFRPLLKNRYSKKELQPFVYNPVSEIMVSYDNADSFGMLFLLYALFYNTD